MKPTTGRKQVRKLLAVLLLLPLAAGCSQIGGNQPVAEQIDPPPADVEQSMLQQSDSENVTADGTDAMNGDVDAMASDNAADGDNEAMAAPENTGDELTVYLQDANGFVAPLTLRMNPDDASSGTPEQTAIAWMTQNQSGGSDEQLPPGFAPLLPQATKVRSVEAEDGAVTIDFDAAFPSVPADRERKVVEALVWTMTELPGVNEVKLQVDGQPLRLLPASGLPLPDSLTRDFGINLEQAGVTSASRAMAVTLYFTAQAEDGEGYFVPVTRLVDYQPDRNNAALQELIKGPLDTTKLQAVLASDMTVEDVSLSQDTVVAALNDPGWEPDTAVSGESMQAIVLTLTGLSGDGKAKIVLNGSADFTDTDNHSYDEPVARPSYINALAG